MRSVLALGAAVWFVGAAILMGDGSIGTAGEPPNEEVLGDPMVMAVYFVARLLFVGLALLGLAIVDWAGVSNFFGRPADEKGGD